MLLMNSFLAFLGVSLIVIVTPGPDTAVTIRNTLFGGRTGGVCTALGIASGQMIWALATGVGIVTLLVASEPLFLAVKYAGAAYLAYLGVQALREAIWPAASLEGELPPSPQASRLTSLAAFRQGLISDLSNPKMAIFFASLLPQFIPAGEETVWALLRFGAAFAVMTFAWLGLYAAVIARAGDILNRQSIRRSIEAVTGTLLIGLGLRIATEHR
jgi:RhtB (resistance to homoserine/threonine) family protein